MTKTKATAIATLEAQEPDEAWETPVVQEGSPVIQESAPVIQEVTQKQEAETSEEPLVGQALLDLVTKAGAEVTKDELVRLAGYTKKVKDGSTRLMYANFMEALLEAQGTPIGVKPSSSKEPGRMGHPLSFRTRVHFNGNIMVGRAYVSMLERNNEKGAEFDVVINPEHNPGGISLVPVYPD